MQTITISEENVTREHICCAFSDKKCSEGYEAKKQWLREQLPVGYTFRKFEIRGKVFAEYVSAEEAWVPVHAPGYMMINCFWVSGQYKGKGYAKQLLQACIKDAEGKNGVVVMTGDKKLPFLSESKFFQHHGFIRCDTAAPYFELWYLPLKPNVNPPSFGASVKDAIYPAHKGLTLYYSHQCPFTEYYATVELQQAVDAHHIPLQIIRIATKEQAQRHCVPFTIYSLFYNGRFITHQILSKKGFEKLLTEFQ